MGRGISIVSSCNDREKEKESSCSIVSFQVASLVLSNVRALGALMTSQTERRTNSSKDTALSPGVWRRSFSPLSPKVSHLFEKTLRVRSHVAERERERERELQQPALDWLVPTPL